MDRSGSDSSSDDMFNDADTRMQPSILLTTTTGSLFKTPPTILKTDEGIFTAGRRFSYWRKLYANEVSATSSASCVFWCLLIETFQGRTSSSTGRYFHLDFVTFVGDCQETPDWWMLGGWLFCRLPLNGMSNKEHTEVIVICCDGLSLAVGLLWFWITHSVNGWCWCWWVNFCQLGRDLFWEMYIQIIQG